MMRKLSADRTDVQGVHHLFAIFLGREPLSVHEVSVYADKPISEVITRLALGEEFAKEVQLPLKWTGYTSTNRFRGEPTGRLVRWLQDVFLLNDETGAALQGADSWRKLLTVLWGDQDFRNVLVELQFDRERIAALSTALHQVDDAAMALKGSVHSQILEGKATFVDLGKSALFYKVDKQTSVLKRVGALTGVRVEAQGCRALRPDPQMYVDLGLGEGSYSLSLNGRFLHENCAPVGSDKAQLFFDFGDGYNESLSLVFPIINGVLAVNGIINLMAPVKALRFDPADIVCSFNIVDFTLGEIQRSQL